jgi:FAD synthase
MWLCFTANLDDATVCELPVDFSCGVFYGFASVDDGPLNGMVMSIGWNPHFKNTQKSMVSSISLGQCQKLHFNPQFTNVFKNRSPGVPL